MLAMTTIISWNCIFYSVRVAESVRGSREFAIWCPKDRYRGCDSWGSWHLATSAPARRSGETMSKPPPPVAYGAVQFSCTFSLSGLQDAYSVTLLRVNATEVSQSGNKGGGCANPPGGPKITPAVVSQLWHGGFNPGPFVNSHTDLVQKGIWTV